MESVTAATAGAIDLSSLPSRLDELASTTRRALNDQSPADRFLRDIAELAMRVMQTRLTVVYRFDDDGSCDAPLSVGNQTVQQEIGSHRIFDLASDAYHSGKTRADRCEDATLIATPTGKIDDQYCVIVSALRLRHSAPDAFVVTQQLIASTVALWQSRQDHRNEKTHRQLESWVNQLRYAIDRSDSFSQASQQIVDSFAIQFDAYQVALSTVRGNKISRIKVVSVGGSGAPIDESEWRAAASESLIRGQVTRWPANLPEDRLATMAHHRLAESTHDGPGSVLSIPIKSDAETPFGVLTIVYSDNEPGPCLNRAQVEECCHAVSANLLNWQQDHRPFFQRAVARLRNCLHSIVAWILSGLVVIGIGMIPVSYRVSGSATITPQKRNFVVAPHAGIIKRTEVRIGDLVTQGQTLAVMDDRELRMELSRLLAQRGHVVKKRDIHRAAAAVADEQLAEFELNSIDQQIRLARHRQRNLLIKSPIDGVVLKGELEDASGAPVEIGQMVAEIAALDQMWIEIGIPEDELAEVHVGMDARVAFDAINESSLRATIDSVSPSAEVRGTENVFIARARIANDTGLLRPGITGIAKVEAEKRPLAAVLFRHFLRRFSRLWI